MAKKCKNPSCGKEFTPKYSTTERHCSRECFNKDKKPNLKLKSPNKINQVSNKRKVLNEVYKTVRIEVLSEAKFKCFIDGCTNVANTLEHLMGRRGFADDFARENNIPLLIDKRYLKACCLVCNGQLETNSELSKKYQYHKISGKKKSDD